MKFQIVVENIDKKKSLMPDGDFEKLVRRVLNIPGFKFIGARSLEGIRAEVWQPAGAKKATREKDLLE